MDQTTISIINLIATFALLIVTIYYAKQTHNLVGANKSMVDEMITGRKKAMMPVFICTVKAIRHQSLVPDDVYNVSELINVIILENCGTSPSFKTEVEVKQVNSEKSRFKIEHRSWKMGIIPLRIPKELGIEKFEIELLDKTEKPRIEIIINGFNGYSENETKKFLFELKGIDDLSQFQPTNDSVWLPSFHWEEIL